jgi:hypothetical protein
VSNSQKYNVFTSHIIKYTHTHTHTHKCPSMHTCTHTCACAHTHVVSATCGVPMISEYLTVSSKERPSYTTLVLAVYCGWSASQLHVPTVHLVIFRPHIRLKHVDNWPTNRNKELKPKLCQTAFLLVILPQNTTGCRT